MSSPTWPGGRRRRRRGQRRARRLSTACSSARTTAWPSGGPPARSSTTAASSTSPRWSACGSRTGGSSTPPTPWCSSWSATARSTGCASTTPTACATRRATSGGCATQPADDHVDRRREDPGARAGGPPALARRRHDGYDFLNGSAGCSSTPPGRRRSPTLYPEVTGVEPADYEIVRRGQAPACCARCSAADVNRLVNLLRGGVRAPPPPPRLHPPGAARRRCGR